MSNTKKLLESLADVPLRSEEQRLLRLLESEKTAVAMKNVLNYIITDAFNLTSEESIWVGHLLNQALEPLRKVAPSAIMGAIRQEELNLTYSQRLFERFNNEPSLMEDISYKEHIKYASASEWTEGLCQIVFACYPNLRPMFVSRIIGSIHGIFNEIGVGEEPDSSRPSAYLPNSIRYLLNS